MSTMPPSSADRPKGWFARNWVWVLILGLGGAGVCCCGAPVAIVFSVFGMLKNSPPYQMALAEVQQSPAVIAELGQPIEEMWIPAGEYKFENNTGYAKMFFTVKGPKSAGIVEFEADYHNGNWVLNALTVTANDKRIDLRAAEANP